MQQRVGKVGVESDFAGVNVTERHGFEVIGVVDNPDPVSPEKGFHLRRIGCHVLSRDGKVKEFGKEPCSGFPQDGPQKGLVGETVFVPAGPSVKETGTAHFALPVQPAGHVASNAHRDTRQRR